VLDYPRCPRCRGQVPLEYLYENGPTSRIGLLLGDGFSINSVGIVCPTCKAKLRVMQWRPLLVSVVGLLFMGVAIFLLMPWIGTDGHAVWILFAVIAVFAFIGLPIAQHKARRLVRLQVVEDSTWLVFPPTEPLEKGDRAASSLPEHDGGSRDRVRRTASGGVTDQELRQDTPAWCVVASVGVALLAAISIFVGSLKVPLRDGLQSISGTVTDAHRRCSRGSCTVTMNLRTSLGEIELSQEDFTSGGLPVARSGVSVTALVSPPYSRREFWELRSNGDLLVSYEEIAVALQAHRRKLSALGYLSAAASIILLVVGIRLGLQRGTWRRGG